MGKKRKRIMEGRKTEMILHGRAEKKRSQKKKAEDKLTPEEEICYDRINRILTEGTTTEDWPCNAIVIGSSEVNTLLLNRFNILTSHSFLLSKKKKKMGLYAEEAAFIKFEPTIVHPFLKSRFLKMLGATPDFLKITGKNIITIEIKSCYNRQEAQRYFLNVPESHLVEVWVAMEIFHVKKSQLIYYYHNTQKKTLECIGVINITKKFEFFTKTMIKLFKEKYKIFLLEYFYYFNYSLKDFDYFYDLIWEKKVKQRPYKEYDASYFKHHLDETQKPFHSSYCKELILLERKKKNPTSYEKKEDDYFDIGHIQKKFKRKNYEIIDTEYLERDMIIDYKTYLNVLHTYKKIDERQTYEFKHHVKIHKQYSWWKEVLELKNKIDYEKGTDNYFLSKEGDYFNHELTKEKYLKIEKIHFTLDDFNEYEKKVIKKESKSYKRANFLKNIYDTNKKFAIQDYDGNPYSRDLIEELQKQEIEIEEENNNNEIIEENNEQEVRPNIEPDSQDKNCDISELAMHYSSSYDAISENNDEKTKEEENKQEEINDIKKENKRENEEEEQEEENDYITEKKEKKENDEEKENENIKKENEEQKEQEENDNTKQEENKKDNEEEEHYIFLKKITKKNRSCSFSNENESMLTKSAHFSIELIKKKDDMIENDADNNNPLKKIKVNSLNEDQTKIFLKTRAKLITFLCQKQQLFYKLERKHEDYILKLEEQIASYELLCKKHSHLCSADEFANLYENIKYFNICVPRHIYEQEYTIIEKTKYLSPKEFFNALEKKTEHITKIYNKICKSIESVEKEIEIYNKKYSINYNDLMLSINILELNKLEEIQYIYTQIINLYYKFEVPILEISNTFLKSITGNDIEISIGLI